MRVLGIGKPGIGSPFEGFLAGILLLVVVEKTVSLLEH
jgi:hypothetical protein